MKQQKEKSKIFFAAVGLIYSSGGKCLPGLPVK